MVWGNSVFHLLMGGMYTLHMYCKVWTRRFRQASRHVPADLGSGWTAISSWLLQGYVKVVEEILH